MSTGGNEVMDADAETGMDGSRLKMDKSKSDDLDLRSDCHWGDPLSQ